jgi:PIN domain nuclease of toxin-antitoxin system
VIKGGFSVIENFIEDNDIEVIPITFEHTKRLLGLEFLHRDPFDRMIIAQSICENLIIVTKDSVFTGYKIKILW